MRIIVNIEFFRKFQPCVDLFILKFFIVETYSLQMDNQVIWNFGNITTFGNICLLITTITLITWNYFSFDKFTKRLVDVSETFYLQWKRVEILKSLVYSFAVWTYCLVACLSTENVFNDIFEWSWFQGSLYSVEEEVEKFLGILLNWNVDWHSIEIFPGKTEFIRIVILTLSEFKIGKECLKLMEDVIINLLRSFFGETFRLTIISHQNQTSERLSHEKLLNHRDHVADTTQISDSCIS